MVNLGVGAATTTGIEVAKKLNMDIVVTIDADGQHNPKDIEKLLQPILRGKADVVIGTRMLNTKGMPTLKIFGNWMMNIITLLIFHKWSTDSQSGMKAFNKKALSKMYFQAMGYEICSEIIGEIQRNKLRFKEIPIEAIYSDYSKLKGQNFINAINIMTRSITIKISRRKCSYL
jgi:glycosyltransferase involved in cell wall biosynthesis